MTHAGWERYKRAERIRCIKVAVLSVAMVVSLGLILLIVGALS